MSGVCLDSSPFIKELAGLDKEQEADKLLIKLRNEVLLCSLVFSYVRHVQHPVVLVAYPCVFPVYLAGMINLQGRAEQPGKQRGRVGKGKFTFL